MRRVGLLAPFFPPLSRVGALRPARWATHLEQFGWEPWVVTLAPQSESPRQDQDASKTLALGHLNATPSKPNEDPSFGRVQSWLDARIPYDGFWPIFWWNQQKIKTWFRDKANIECLVSTGDPWSAHWLGRKLAHDLQIPWIADFRDPWTLSRIPLRNRSHGSFKKDANREARILQDADAITFTSETALRRYQEAFPLFASKMSVIHNSAGSIKRDIEKAKHAQRDKVAKEPILLFFGSFRRLSPAEPWLTLFRKVTKRSKQQGITLPSVKLLSSNRSFNPFEEFSWIKHEALEAIDSSVATPVLNQSTILLLSTHPDRDDIIPAKLWDYLPARPHILSLGSSKDVKRILEQTERGTQFDTRSEDQLAQASEWFVKHLFEKTTQPGTLSEEWLTKIDPHTMTSTLSKLLDQLSGSKPETIAGKHGDSQKNTPIMES